MLRHSPRPSTARTTSRAPHPAELRATWAAAHSYAQHEVAARSSALHEHMLRDHGRTGRETDGLPLADLHRFEHVEQAMGLNALDHEHPADVETGTHVSAEPDEDALTGVLA